MSSLGETRHSTTTLSFGVQNDCIKTAAKFGGVAQTRIFFSIQRIFAEDESIQITRIAEAIEAIEEAGDSHTEVKEAANGGVVEVKEAATDGVAKEPVLKVLPRPSSAKSPGRPQRPLRPLKTSRSSRSSKHTRVAAKGRWRRRGQRSC